MSRTCYARSRGNAISNIGIFRPANRTGQKDRTTLSSYQPALHVTSAVIGVSVAITDISGRCPIDDSLRTSGDHHRHMVELNY